MDPQYIWSCITLIKGLMRSDHADFYGLGRNNHYHNILLNYSISLSYILQYGNLPLSLDIKSQRSLSNMLGFSNKMVQINAKAK